MWKKVKQTIDTISGKIYTKAQNWLDDISLRRKLAMMYILCVLFPLIVTDSVIISILIRADKDVRQQEMNNTADAIQYHLNITIENAVELSQNIYSNRFINEFIEQEYDKPLDYYIAYQNLLKDSLYETSVERANYHAVIYADNQGFLNGGYFARLEKVLPSVWYKAFLESGREITIFPHYAEVGGDSMKKQKTLSVIRKMDYYNKGKSGNVLKLDLDYSAITRSIINAKYAYTVYVCSEDKILFSNDQKGGVSMPFMTFPSDVKDKVKVHKQMNVYGQYWDIYVLDNQLSIVEIIRNNIFLLLFLILINVGLPLIFMQGITHSLTNRLRLLSDAFEKKNGDYLQPVSDVKGKDEIGVLMTSYNHMVERMNELIQTVYKDKLRAREMDIARQKAELLALHSQINPHFLFNVLESIRMHSLLKKEYETADMVEKLALMQRQNVEWGNDSVTIGDEASFAEAYLELQKYRFGDRLSYRITVEESCRELYIPRLTLVTFVENACIHGIENKAAPGWIFVRCYTQKKEICLEIEDTGNGMTPCQVNELQRTMNQASIDQLQEKGHVGILNACIRLKMMTGDSTYFKIESEEGIGTTVTIHLSKGRGKDDAEGTACR